MSENDKTKLEKYGNPPSISKGLGRPASSPKPAASDVQPKTATPVIQKPKESK